MIENKDPWVVNLKNELYRIGLDYIWELENIDTILFYKIKERVEDIFKQECSEQIRLSPKGHLYQYMHDGFNVQGYLRKPVDTIYLKEIAKIRMSAHNLILKGKIY